MGRPAKQYSPEQVTGALMQLVANGGNAAQTAKQVEIPEQTLRAWKNDVHSEQYRRIEDNHGRELERQAVEQARETIVRAGEIERELLEKARTARPDVVPQALRAVTDVKAKNVDRMLALTGRPVQPKETQGDIVQLLKTMMDKGYVRLAAGISLDENQGGSGG